MNDLNSRMEAQPEPEPELSMHPQQSQLLLEQRPQLPVWPPQFNLAACGCVGCHIADAAAPWILSRSAPCRPVAPDRASHVSLSKGEDTFSLSARQLTRDDTVGGRSKSSGVDLELTSSGVLTAVNRRATEPMVVYLTVVMQATASTEHTNTRTGDTHDVAAAGAPTAPPPLQEEVLAAVATFKRAHPEMGVKKLSAAFKKVHPDMPGIGAKEIRAALRSLTINDENGALKFEGRGGQALLFGKTRPNENAEWADALTVVITVTPGEELHLATVSGGLSGPAATVQTFVFPLAVHPASGVRTESAVQLTHWPLPTSACPALCTQGVGGRLTHFFPESFHAVDLRCEDGTVLLAVADGVVTNIEAKKSASGISSANLVEWNALTLALDAPGPTGEVVLIDYVHIRAHSAMVRPGTCVKQSDPFARPWSFKKCPCSCNPRLTRRWR